MQHTPAIQNSPNARSGHDKQPSPNSFLTRASIFQRLVAQALRIFREENDDKPAFRAFDQNTKPLDARNKHVLKRWLQFCLRFGNNCSLSPEGRPSRHQRTQSRKWQPFK